MKSKVKIVQPGHVPSAKEYMEKLEAVMMLAALVEYAESTPIAEYLKKSIAPHCDVMESILQEHSEMDCNAAVLSATSKLLNAILNGN